MIEHLHSVCSVLVLIAVFCAGLALGAAAERDEQRTKEERRGWSVKK